MVGGRQPSVEDDLRGKMTFSGGAISEQGRRLRFGMLTVLTNIRSTKVLKYASRITHHASCVNMHHASCIAGRRLRFGMLTDLTNVRSTFVGR